MWAKIFILIALVGIGQMASSASVSQASDRGLFAADLFTQISKGNTVKNVIISPISVQTALGIVYLGAEGETAKELEKGLRLPSSDKEEIGKRFANILNENNGGAELNIANRLFINCSYQLLPKFNELAKKYFNSEAETVNFSQSAEAIKIINTWIEQNTNNKITNLMQPGSVNGDTRAIIVNTVYFKGEWEKPFSKDSTHKSPFWVSPTKSIEVDTMFGDEQFNYAEYPTFDATAIEMPYKNSNISMIVILPNQRDGLAKLEENISSVAINDLYSKMTIQKVKVFMPKFKIEYATGLTEVLKELGIRSIFEDNADLSGIFQSGPPLKVSDVQTKAFIDVNEAGSEAAAATVIQISLTSVSINQKNFNVDHPFVFVIKSPAAVYFVGHVASP